MKWLQKQEYPQKQRLISVSRISAQIIKDFLFSFFFFLKKEIQVFYVNGKSSTALWLQITHSLMFHYIRYFQTEIKQRIIEQRTEGRIMLFTSRLVHSFKHNGPANSRKTEGPPRTSTHSQPTTLDLLIKSIITLIQCNRTPQTLYRNSITAVENFMP